MYLYADLILELHISLNILNKEENMEGIVGKSNANARK